ncbi:hypothetical protein G3N56_11570 [Desulfovibrio sulfodismutans]|uniref:DUF7680 domain-containing protein n=1 Tax=Desulfolutivibrio sulfodismutans TaxID=63561 RepID=A0A7K3NMG4_9BACT|nr:hypothetical protein [Desulfolutivibrio sulfodismutans]NDY57380.1 hypothetical protein [Desulfolutivibrio sulfodismutans]QLA12920.1 hypothetical protein GD606_11870 [Desulfolutivibrio sulfodismutans DSM 3696]
MPKKIPDTGSPQTVPQYELRARQRPALGLDLDVWQVPSPSTPNIAAPVRIAGLGGRNLSLVEHRILRRLGKAGIGLGGIALAGVKRFPLDENMALNLGLLFRVLAPMRNRDNMRAVAEGVEAMAQEEASYWLGMAMHRKNPRRVLMALRILLTEPKGQ